MKNPSTVFSFKLKLIHLLIPERFESIGIMIDKQNAVHGTLQQYGAMLLIK